jgi:hypothetical protein
MLPWRVGANPTKRFSIEPRSYRLSLTRRSTITKATAHTEFGTVWILMAALGTEHTYASSNSLQKSLTSELTGESAASLKISQLKCRQWPLRSNLVEGFSLKSITDRNSWTQCFGNGRTSSYV